MLVIPRELLAVTIEKAEQRAVHEKGGIAAINAGQSLFEVHDLQAALDRNGAVEIDKAWGDA